MHHDHHGSTRFGAMLTGLAGDLGKGLLAGLVGTAAMTASQALMMKVQGGEDSEVPAEAVKEVFDVEGFEDQQAKMRAVNLIHWSYGTSWGALRGLLGAAGMSSKAATISHFFAVWGAAGTMLPALDLTPPPIQWPPRQIASDALHHGVYAVATGIAYEWLARQ